MIQGREFLGDDMLLPAGILVPDDEVFVGEQDVRLFVPVDVRHGYAVADLDFGIHVHRFERWNRGRRGGDGEERSEQGGKNGVHGRRLETRRSWRNGFQRPSQAKLKIQSSKFKGN